MENISQRASGAVVVSSDKKISISLITTMSGRAEESKVSVGIACGRGVVTKPLVREVSK